MIEDAKTLGLGRGGGSGGGGEGPPSSSLRPLALHCAEQWAGRARPECLEVIFVLSSVIVACVCVCSFGM